MITTMIETTAAGDRCVGGNIVLPIPFHELISVFDQRAKGSWIIVNISQNWDVSVLKC